MQTRVIFLNLKLEEYLFSFQKQTVAKIVRVLELLELYGKHLKMPYSRQPDLNLYELRVRGKEEIRIFYCYFNDTAVIVHVFPKKTQRTPAKELKTAHSRIQRLTSK